LRGDGLFYFRACPRDLAEERLYDFMHKTWHTASGDEVERTVGVIRSLQQLEFELRRGVPPPDWLRFGQEVSKTVH